MLPAAQMAPSGDHARASQGAAKHVADGSVLAEHLSVGSGEDELAARLVESALQIRHQFGRDRNRFFVRTFRRAIVAVAHHQQTASEVDVALAQPDQLALAQAGVDGRGEERHHRSAICSRSAGCSRTPSSRSRRSRSVSSSSTRPEARPCGTRRSPHRRWPSSIATNPALPRGWHPGPPRQQHQGRVGRRLERRCREERGIKTLTAHCGSAPAQADYTAGVRTN